MWTYTTEWTRVGGVKFAKYLEQALAPHYHVGLTGSVLTKGKSFKDLDLIVFPHSSRRRRPKEIRKLLQRAGMRLMVNRETMTKRWRSIGSLDNKHVEAWHFKGRRIDVIFLR